MFPRVNYINLLSKKKLKKGSIFIEFYDEWCLVENPYFQVSEMDCWPCSSVRSIPDLTSRNISSEFNFAIPYTREDDQVAVKMENLLEMYEKNMHIFDNDASRVFSNNGTYRYNMQIY